jgi:tetratricopeptide (TPR) repeat protein
VSRKSKSKSKKAGLKGPEPRREWSVEELRRAGTQAFHAGQYHEAVVHWSAAYQRDPSEVWAWRLAEAYFRRGLSFYREERMEQVISDLHWAVKLYPQSPLYHYHLGLAYHRRRNFERAVACYGRALELAPEVDRYRYHFGLACIDGGIHIGAAQQMFEALAAADPANVQWKHPLAVIFLKQGEWEKAARYLEDLWAQGGDSAATEALLGLVHLQQGHFPEARDWLEQAVEGFAAGVEADPRARRALGLTWHYLGLVQAREGNLAAARESWERAYQLGFRSSQLESNLARACQWAGAVALREGRLAEAVQYWERAVALGANDKESKRDLLHLYFLYAHQLAEEERFEEAAGYYEKVAEGERSPEIIHNLALVYDRLNRPEKSMAHWQRVIKEWEKQFRSEPHHESLRRNLNEAHKHLARNCLKLGQDQRACRELQQALSYWPEDLEARKLLAEAQLSAGRYEEAIEILEQLVEERPEEVDILVNLGIAYDLNGEQEDALDAWEEALERQPDHPVARQQILRTIEERTKILLLLGRFDEAIREIESKLDILSEDPVSRCELAGLFLVRKQERRAREHFEKAYRSDPQNVEVALAIGKQYLLYGYPRQAREWFNRAEGLRPEDPEVWVRIGGYYLRAKQQDQAEEYFRAAREKAGEDPGILRRIARHLFDERQLEQALEYFERYLEREPTDAEALYRLAHCYAYVGDYDRADEFLDQAEQQARAQGRQDLLEAIAEDQEFGWEEYEEDEDDEDFPGFF